MSSHGPEHPDRRPAHAARPDPAPPGARGDDELSPEELEEVAGGEGEWSTEPPPPPPPGGG